MWAHYLALFNPQFYSPFVFNRFPRKDVFIQKDLPDTEVSQYDGYLEDLKDVAAEMNEDVFFICYPGAWECIDSSNRHQCNSTGDGWKTSEACSQESPICSEGQCYYCVPNSYICIDDSTRQQCNASGTGWLTSEKCGENKYCQNGECNNYVCKPLEWSCFDDFSKHQCDDKGLTYGSPEGCGDGKYCDAGDCKDQICTPQEWVCTGDFTRHQCNLQGSDWEVEQNCDTNKYCDIGNCTNQICNPYSWECASTSSKHQCNSKGSEWLVAENCPTQYPACFLSNCVTCLPDQWLCISDTTRHQCNSTGDGWLTASVCPDSAPVCKDGNCIYCVPDSYQCLSNSFRQKCNNLGTGWFNPKSCGDQAVCVDGTCLTQLCTPTYWECSDNFNRRQCNSIGSAFNPPEYCGAGKYCESGICNNQICTPASWSCLDDFNIQQCNTKGSQWGTADYCGSGKYCNTGLDNCENCSYSQFNPVQHLGDRNGDWGTAYISYIGYTTYQFPTNWLMVQIWQASPYKGPTTPGTYTIIDENYSDCGLCVLMAHGCNASNTCSKIYLATSGTMEITTMGDTEENFAAILTNVFFEEVTISGGVSTKIPDGEIWCLEGYSFDEPTYQRLNCTSLDFDGINDKVNVGSFSLSSYTVSLWMKSSDTTDSNIISSQDGRHIVRFESNGTLAYSGSSTPVNDGVWHHIVKVANAS